MSGTPAFHRLSEELLTMIVEEVEDSYVVGGETIHLRNLDSLRALRLTHPRFAYLDACMRRLFYMIALPTDSFGLDKFEKTKLDAVFPFARGVKFFQSAYVPGLAFEQFREIFWQKRRQTEQEQGTEEDAKAAFEIYDTRAKADRDTIASGRAKKILLSTVKQIPQAHHFIVGRVDKIRAKANNALQPFDLTRAESSPECEYLRGLQGDELLLLATNIIEKSDPKPETLQIEGENTGRSEFTPIDSWERIDLSRLVKFEYRGEVRGDPELPYEERDAFVDHFNTLITTIANQAASTLRHMKLHGAGSWETPENACEKLQRLDLAFMRLGDNFDSWLKRCPALKSLQLLCTSGIGMDTFWIIRHMQPLMLEMQQVPCNEAMEATMSHYTSDWVEYTYDPDGEYFEEWEDALKAFLCGSADASPHLLEMWDEEEWEPPDE